MNRPPRFAWADWLGYGMTPKHDKVAMPCALRTDAPAPISRLPLEILTFIFYLVMIEDQLGTPRYSNFWFSSFDWSWITLTHVCRHWRHIALQDARLWSTIRSGRRLLVQELMLKRSKASPLSYYGSMLNVCEELQILLHASRIRVLSLEEKDPKMAERIFGTLMTGSALLESLSLRYLGNPYQNFILPLGLLRKTAPLRHLALHDVWIPWSAPILCGLTSLRIVLSPDEVPSRPLPTYYSAAAASPYEQLLCALERMPSLETLHLCNAIPPRSGSEYAHDRVVDLPCLRTLDLTGAVEDCLHLVKSIKIPSSCDMLLTECVAKDSAAKRHTFDAELRSGCNDKITRQRCRARIAFAPRSTGALDALCRALPVTVRAFHSAECISCGSQWPPETWTHLFKRCNALEDIRLTHDSALSFCLALIDDKPTEVQLLPSLRSVEFTGVDFGDTSGGGRRVRVLYFVLAEWIMLRGMAKQPRIVLHIQKCDIWKQWVAKLKQTCQVEWDGNEGHCRGL